MRKKILLSAALIAVSFTTFAQVGVGTTTPDASAILDVTSTTQGFLPPRMSEAQMNSIASPAEGIIVYCLDCTQKGLYMYDGTRFNNIATGTPANSVGVNDIVSATGLVWADRNLGATQVATSSTDAAAYGDLYQWGRVTDGHQLRTSATTVGPVVAGSEGVNFITVGAAPYDWLTVQDDNRWYGEASANNPCPSGYRVPSDYEWQAERNTWVTKDATGAYSALKLPLAGYRRSSNGTLFGVGSGGGYWSSTASGTYARYLHFNSSTTDMRRYHRAYGFSVRCIKD